MTYAIFTYFDGRIPLNPAVCNGSPTRRNTRVTAQTVLEYLRALVKTISTFGCS